MKKIKSFKTKDILKESEVCGCFYCLKTFIFDEIKKFTDNNETAICPRCNIDSVIGDKQCEYPLYPSLEKMHIHSFCWGYSGQDLSKKIWTPSWTYKNQIQNKHGDKLKHFEFED